MGISNNALLVYGIDLGEDRPQGEDELENILFQHFHPEVVHPEYPEAELSGVGRYWSDEVKSHPKYLEWSRLSSEYYAASRQWADANSISKVEIIYYCTYDYPMYLLGVEKMNVSRGDLGEIKPETLEIDLSWDKDIAKVCEILSVVYSQPKWYLTTMNG